jgi:hypothetical protein
MAYTTPRLHALAPFLLLAGCVPGTSVSPPAPAVVARPPVISSVGLEGVMGANARALAALLGAADLDIREGTARKLQFSSTVCVLDAYLYPRSTGAEPVVTHVDARLLDGRDMDRASCVAALRARGPAR